MSILQATFQYGSLLKEALGEPNQQYRTASLVFPNQGYRNVVLVKYIPQMEVVSQEQGKGARRFVRQLRSSDPEEACE